MDEDRFWQIIEESKAGTNGSHDAQEKNLRAILTRLSVAEIAKFDRIFNEMLIKSYTWELWGAAYLINGGCSDDGFEYFRRALIADGRERFEAAVGNAESLADWSAEDVEFESIRYVVYDAYRAKTKTRDLPPNELHYPKDPTGESWEEDDLERRFPKLAEKFGGS